MFSNDDDVTAGQVMHAERQDRHEEVEMLRAAIAKMQVHARPFVGASHARYWSPWLVLGAIVWVFIAKS